MKIWSKLNYVFMWLAITLAVVSMGISIYLGQSWTWQFGTAIWAFIAYVNQKTIDKYERETNQFIDQVKSDMDKIIEKSKTK